MKTIHRSRTGVLAALATAVLLLAAAPGGARAEEKPSATPTQEKSQPSGAGPRYEPPAPPPKPQKTDAGALYVPPAIGFPGRRIGAGTRGMGRVASLQVLAPDHLGYTTVEQPTLYWYLAEPTTLRIDFTLRDETSVEPLVDVELKKIAGAGVQAIRLADHEVRLRTGVNYHWFVSLVPDAERRSKDFTAGAWISRREPDAALRKALAAGDGRDALAYAQAGFWYDAIGALSSRIDAAPREGALRAQRAALLDQVGLSEVATHDLAAAGD